MQLPDKELEQLLEQYHRGTASPEERRMLEQWYEQLDITAGQQWQSAEQEVNTRDEIYAGLTTKMAFSNRREAEELPTPAKAALHRIGWRKISRIAAVLLVAAGTAWIGQTIWRKQLVAGPVKPAEHNEPTSPPIAIKPAHELTVQSGYTNKKKIVLPDGSTAWLNARSVLKYPDHFTGNTRTVKIEQGEVFFSVIHDTTHPFIVYAGSVATTVLGTSFLVKQTYEKNTIEVSVKTGRVKVEKFNRTGGSAQVGRYLLPGDQLSFDTTANLYRLKQVVPKGIAAFTEGKLIYDDATLEEIVYDISRKYNVNIRFDNERLMQCHYRISFDDMTLSDCLQILSALTNTQIEKRDIRHYTIKGESCN